MKRALIPRSYVEAVEALESGFTLGQLEYWSVWIEARLRKTYPLPFSNAQAEMLRGWLARVVTWRVLWRRGISPTDEQAAELQEDAKEAMTEIKEAANGENSLFDLGDNDGDTSTTSNVGGTRVYSEASPYVSADEQARIGRAEDDRRYGTMK